MPVACDPERYNRQLGSPSHPHSGFSSHTTLSESSLYRVLRNKQPVFLLQSRCRKNTVGQLPTLLPSNHKKLPPLLSCPCPGPYPYHPLTLHPCLTNADWLACLWAAPPVLGRVYFLSSHKVKRSSLSTGRPREASLHQKEARENGWLLSGQK